MKLRSLILSMVLITIASIGISAQAKTEGEIQKVMDDQAAAWNKGDIEGFMRGYWQSDKLTFVGSKGVTRGWSATLENYKKGYPTKEKMGALTFSELEFTHLSPSAVVVLGKWSLKRAADAPGGYFTLLFIKKKEGWKIVQDHTS